MAFSILRLLLPDIIILISIINYHLLLFIITVFIHIIIINVFKFIIIIIEFRENNEVAFALAVLTVVFTKALSALCLAS